MVKHAGPHAHAHLVVDVSPETVRISVVDDGPTTRPTNRAGFGLVGMRERVELLGGRIRAGHRSPGWVLEVTIPTGGAP